MFTFGQTERRSESSRVLSQQRSSVCLLWFLWLFWFLWFLWLVSDLTHCLINVLQDRSSTLICPLSFFAVWAFKEKFPFKLKPKKDVFPRKHFQSFQVCLNTKNILFKRWNYELSKYLDKTLKHFDASGFCLFPVFYFLITSLFPPSFSLSFLTSLLSNLPSFHPSFFPFHLSFLPSFYLLLLYPHHPPPPVSFFPSAEGVHPGERRGGGACVAAGAGDRGGQRALAPPPSAAVLHVAAQTSECMRRPATDCRASANANTHASSIWTQSAGGRAKRPGEESKTDRASDRTGFLPLQKILFLIIDITSDGLLFFCSCCGQTGFCA